MSSSSILSFWKIIVGRDARRPTRSLPCISFHLNAARRPAQFAPACPQSQRTRFSSANRGPENPKKGARRPAQFAPACPQSQRTLFSSANRGSENPEKGGRRPARFAHTSPQSQRTRFSSANPGDAQNSKTHPTRRRSPPARQRLNQSGGAPPAGQRPSSSGPPAAPAHFGGARRPGPRPGEALPEGEI